MHVCVCVGGGKLVAGPQVESNPTAEAPSNGGGAGSFQHTCLHAATLPWHFRLKDTVEFARFLSQQCESRFLKPHQLRFLSGVEGEENRDVHLLGCS